MSSVLLGSCLSLPRSCRGRKGMAACPRARQCGLMMILHITDTTTTALAGSWHLGVNCVSSTVLNVTGSTYFDPHNIPVREILLSIPFCRRGNTVLEGLHSNFQVGLTLHSRALSSLPRSLLPGWPEMVLSMRVDVLGGFRGS